MSKKAFEEALASLLEVSVDELAAPGALGNNPLWDSLSIVSALALIEQYYYIVLSGEALGTCQSLDEIYALIDKHGTSQEALSS
ncbi:MAG: acyl carrier protein [Pseudomonadota bacterium]